MAEKLWFLIPELVVFGGVVLVVLLGLSQRASVPSLEGISVSISIVAGRGTTTR